VHETQLRELVDTRVHRPQAIAEAAVSRRQAPALAGEHGRLMIITADHPARGALRAGASGLGNTVMAAWRKTLQLPTVRGFVIGRSLLFPPDDNVAAAVDAVAEML
jgi:Cgl0159-like